MPQINAVDLVPLYLPGNSKQATKLLVEYLVDSLWPTTLQMKNKMAVLDEMKMGGQSSLAATRGVFALCCSQIHKCMLHLIEIFQLEHRNNILMQESRDCTLERLSWCLKKLSQVQKTMDEVSVKTNRENNNKDISDDSESFEGNNESINRSTETEHMYFVNWIDHTLEILTNLSTTVYKTDCTESNEQFDTWKNEVIDSVSGLHTSVDELLLSAMTLCRHGLPADQPVLTTRCQVVLRETKNLISEIIEGDVDKVYTVTKDSLKLPLRPTNINVLIDVLKDTLYVLETNTNTALLALLVHCFSKPLAPLDNLLEHFKEGIKGCPCKNIEDVEDCVFVRDFDFYNERLMQIGGFSISCSSDENRILSLKSGLASLEALDPHLVPAIIVAPAAPHATFLAAAWRREVLLIRASIFLIVDPAAFSERVKDIMHKKLLELFKNNAYKNGEVCAVIDYGQIVLDFFCTYSSQEPEALQQRERLEPLLADLTKALKECKTVSNLSSNSEDDFLYDLPIGLKVGKNITFDQLLKRLKLLFTVVGRINSLFRSDDTNDGNSFGDECDDATNSGPLNLTHTINIKNPPSVVKKQASIKPFARHANNASKNTFARIDQTDPSKCIITKMSKRLNRNKMQDELSFSVQLDELFNDISQYTTPKTCDSNTENGSKVIAKSCIANKNLSKMQNTSILYNVPLGSDRQSLRKVVLNKNYLQKTEKNYLPPVSTSGVQSGVEMDFDMSQVLDSTSNLQITDILNQLSDISRSDNRKPQGLVNKTVINISSSSALTENPNILTLSVNGNMISDQLGMSKSVWRIPVSSSILDDTRPSEVSVGSSTQSNVTTQERLNDIDLIENRLNQLKSSNV